MSKYNAIDVFSGVGGLSVGLKKAGFRIVACVESNNDAIRGYKLNHRKTKVFAQDIREVDTEEIKNLLHDEPLHLLAGCPPCQGFSSLRRLNRKKNIRDPRNSLILEYLRFVRELKPLTLMLENVPGLKTYYLFKQIVEELKELGYNPHVEIVNVQNFGVPQRRQRLVLVGSRLGKLEVFNKAFPKKTVRAAIGHLPNVEDTADEAHKIYPTHTSRIQTMITMIPKNGGSRKDLPADYILECHKRENVGFDDVYGRLRWDDYSSTITGGCMNPSKGRFLHPEENRCITAREAALLQTFPHSYRFPLDITRDSLSLLIGNALPPQFSYIQSKSIRKHLDSISREEMSKLAL